MSINWFAVELATKLLAIVVVALLLSAWITMLTLGGLAHIFQAPNLAIDYPHSFLAGICIGILSGGYGAVLSAATR